MATLGSIPQVCATCMWWVERSETELSSATDVSEGDCSCPCGGLHGIPLKRSASCDCWRSQS